jgi:hypothetical protein
MNIECRPPGRFHEPSEYTAHGIGLAAQYMVNATTAVLKHRPQLELRKTRQRHPSFSRLLKQPVLEDFCEANLEVGSLRLDIEQKIAVSRMS